jgi:hypothetical protein
MWSAQAVEALIAVAGAAGSLVVATATLVWFIADQFKKNRRVFYEGLTALHNAVTSKLDEHEKKDDKRFEMLTSQVFDIQLRNARIDGAMPPKRPIAHAG